MKTKFIFILVFTFTSLTALPTWAESLPDPAHLKAEMLPISLNDLRNIPAKNLPEAVQKEIIEQHSGLEGSKNNWFDYLLVGIRTTVNTASVTYGFMIKLGSLDRAIVPGLVGGMMSGALQLWQPKVNHWLSHKSKMNSPTDLPGIFRVSETQKANFIESFFLKQFSTGVVYYNVCEAVANLFSQTPQLFSFRPTESAFIDLFSAGLLNVIIATQTERLAAKFPNKSQLTWHLSKVSTLVVSMVSTFASIMFLNQQPWAKNIQIGMIATGSALFIATSEPIRKFYSRASSVISKACRSSLSALFINRKS